MTIAFPNEAFVVHVHGKHIYCWSDKSKTKNNRKAFSTILLPF